MADNIQRSLGNIEAKVDLLLADTGDHETRIRSMEEGRARRTGGLVVLMMIVTWISNLALRKL